MTDAPDEVLVGRVLAGDRECYSTLVRRYQDALYRHARGMGLDHDVALDMVQEALVKGYMALDRCRDPARFRTWLSRILRNRCLDHIKDIRRNAVPLEKVPLVDPSATPGADAARAELRVALEGALRSLSPEMREAFLLKHQAGYSYEELAEIADASVSAMKMRVHRAREALQERLAEVSAADEARNHV